MNARAAGKEYIDVAIRRQPVSPVHHGIVAAHTLLVLVWLGSYVVRYTVFAYGTPASDPQYFTNWNFFMTGSFLCGTVVALTCSSALDSVLHLGLLSVVWASNAITLFGSIPILANNATLMRDSTTPWYVVFVGDRLVHVFVCLWLAVYTVWRVNDLRWMWHAHGGLDFSVLVGRHVCVPLCWAACCVRLRRARSWRHALPIGTRVGGGGGGGVHIEASPGRAAGFAVILAYQFVAALALPALYLMLLPYPELYGVPLFPTFGEAFALVVALAAPCVALLMCVLVAVPPWEVRAAVYAHGGDERDRPWTVLD